MADFNSTTTSSNSAQVQFGENSYGTFDAFYVVAYQRDTTAPSIANLVGPILENRVSPVTFDVLDTNPGVALVTISINYAGTPDWITVYDGLVFLGRFSATSVVTTITNGLHFSVVPAGGWDSEFTIRIPAVDNDGSKVEL